MDTISLILSIIGSLNWGLVSVFQFDLVAWLFGGQAAIMSRIIYVVVALAGIWCISLFFRENDMVGTMVTAPSLLFLFLYTFETNTKLLEVLSLTRIGCAISKIQCDCSTFAY